jgi:hypothetical protein
MEKEFIPYEQALALKELRFDEPCFTSYNNKNLVNWWVDAEWVKNSELIEVYTTAPTYSQAFRWFREKHDLLNDVGISAHRRNDVKKWMYSIIYLDKNTYIYSEGTYNTYEEAELECLKELIEIVKNKQK